MSSDSGRNRRTPAQIALQTHDLAVTAMTRIEGHEAECNRREEARIRREAQFQRQYESDMGDVKRALEQVNGRIFGIVNSAQSLLRAVGGALIFGLGSAVVWLLLHGRPWE
jgi:hypothetical protein